MKRFLKAVLVLVVIYFAAVVTLGGFIFFCPPWIGIPVTLLGCAALITWRKEFMQLCSLEEGE